METQIRKLHPEIENLAALMDDRFKLFGFTFGLNFFIDLIPGIGDITTTLVAIYIFRLATKYKLSKFAIFRMAMNILIYFLVGLIPAAGDLFGVWWKPNRRNVTILQENLGA
jgi:hypothetical protein